jgi:hypothetical protein
LSVDALGHIPRGEKPSTSLLDDVCDLSGKPLSALPKWGVSVGGEYVHDASFVGLTGQFFADVEANWRTETFGDPSYSKSTVVPSSISAWVCLRRGPRQVSPGRRNIAPLTKPGRNRLGHFAF